MLYSNLILRINPNPNLLLFGPWLSYTSHLPKLQSHPLTKGAIIKGLDLVSSFKLAFDVNSSIACAFRVHEGWNYTNKNSAF